ncbi:MAG TPA: lamin tail domain-containing protein [Verrucomicrobiae bacterium]|jgi:hypothetical protein
MRLFSHGGAIGPVLLLACASLAQGATTNVTLLSITNSWKVDLSKTDLGTAWRQPAFDDSAWGSGPALFFKTAASLPAPKLTPLNIGPTTYYFRGTFFLNAPTQLVTLSASTVIDDGAVVYLNGAEVLRLGLPSGTVGFLTVASRIVADATFEGPFPLPNTNLLAGTNHVAVEVHQANPNGNDVAFGLSLTAAVPFTNAPQLQIVLNEVLADNQSLTNASGVVADWVELFNRNGANVDLSGMSLTDDPANPRRYVFPSGWIIPANSHRVIECAGGAAPSAANTGFGLSAAGEAVYLYERPANGGLLVDSIVFGLQAANLSIGRVPSGTGNWSLNQPTRGAANVAAALGNPASLKLNEWLGSSTGNGDWFELYNPGSQPMALSGLFLTDTSDTPALFPIAPLSFIGAGSFAYRRFFADTLVLAGADHVNFKLAGSGGFVGLYSSDGTPIDGVSFGRQELDVSEGRWPDGSADILRFPDSPSPGHANYLPITNIGISEVLTHTDVPLEDAVELFNPTGAPVDVSGWYLSNTLDDPRKFRLPNGTIISAGGYKVIYENQFNAGPTAFTFNSAHGDQAYLSVYDLATNFGGYQTFVAFGAAANSVSFGRFETSVGVDFVAMSARTFGVDNPSSPAQFRIGPGLPNTYPVVGPVVINEIMYHPVTLVGGVPTELPEEEYIELHNLKASPLPLFDPAFPTNTWSLQNAIDFRFPTNTTFAANGYLLLVPFDPVTNAPALASFRAKYSVPTNVPTFGPFSRRLGNGGDAVELYRPDVVQMAPHPDAGFVPQILVDHVNYGALPPWPTNAAGGGASLQRRFSTEYGNDPANWEGKATTAGLANGPDVITAPGIISSPSSLTANRGSFATMAVSAAGTHPLSYQWRLHGTNFIGATNAALEIPCSQNVNAGAYTVVVSNPAGSATSTPATLSVGPPAPPTVIQPSLHGTNFVLSVNTKICLTYIVECKDTLAAPSWTILNTIAGNGATMTITNLSATVPRRFYRVRIQ